MDPYINNDTNSLKGLIPIEPILPANAKDLSVKDSEFTVTTKSIFPKKDQKILNAFSQIMQMSLIFDKDYLNVNGGQKYSRHTLKDLSHSYVHTINGDIYQILHQSGGRYPNQKKDSQKIVIGAGGFKLAKIVLDSQGNQFVMGIVHEGKQNSVSNAIAASKNTRFKSCENLLV